MPIKLNSSGGGSVTLDVPATGSTFNLTVPANNATLFTNTGGSITGSVSVSGLISTAGITSSANVSVTGSISATGRLSSSTTSQNFSVSSATAITVNTTTPTTIASTSITTTGKPVLLVATGDCNPAVSGDWHFLRIDRAGSRVGKLIINQTSGASHNNPFALCHIDTPSAGTHTYELKAYQGSGSITYGETGNDQAPTILAVELI
jgi:hypothetical protein